MNSWYSLDTEKVTKYSRLIMLDLGKYLHLKKMKDTLEILPLLKQLI